MSASEETLALLWSIDASLKALVRQSAATAPKLVASDSDLDGQHGNPVVRFIPRDWSGADMKGAHFSECPANFLDMLSAALDWSADKADAGGELTPAGKPKSVYKRADAARARGWAARIRDGKVAPTDHGMAVDASQGAAGVEADDIPWATEGAKW